MLKSHCYSIKLTIYYLKKILARRSALRTDFPTRFNSFHCKISPEKEGTLLLCSFRHEKDGLESKLFRNTREALNIVCPIFEYTLYIYFRIYIYIFEYTPSLLTAYTFPSNQQVIKFRNAFSKVSG